MQRKHLVFSVVGDTSLHRMWALNAERSFDLWLIYYGDDAARAEQYAGECDRLMRFKGQKLHLMETLREQGVFDWSGYECVWLPDDDLAIAQQSIEELFAAMARHGIAIGQPAVCGYPNHRITEVQVPFTLRWTNFVEVMAPCFSAAALAACAPSFKENVSSYGLDHWWWHLIGRPRRGCAILDRVVMVHTRPFQSMLRYDDAYGEAEALFQAHGIDREMKVLSGEIGRVRVPRWAARLLNRLLND